MNLLTPTLLTWEESKAKTQAEPSLFLMVGHFRGTPELHTGCQGKSLAVPVLETTLVMMIGNRNLEG